MADFLRALGQAAGFIDPDPAPSAAPPPAKEDIVSYQPYPTEDPLDEIFLEKTVPCTSCALTIGSNTSTSTVTIQRSVGAIAATDCYRYDNDVRKRTRGELSDYQLGVNLSRGLYSTPSSQGYCQELMITDDDLLRLAKGDALTTDMVRRKRVLPVSGNGGFSSNTKAIYSLPIPIAFRFTGMATSLDPATKQKKQTQIDLPVNVTHLSLFYPAPLRTNGVQADACIALNDPAQNRGQKVIVLIPLVASPSGGEPSADFIRRLAQYVAVVRDVDPSTGEYPSTTIQTGSSWKISNLFSLKATNGAKSVLDQADGATEYYRVANGFYVWKPATQYEIYQEVTDGDITQQTTMNKRYVNYRWRPVPSDTAPTYIMLDYPVAIDSVDLVALTRNLPTTPPLMGIHKIPKTDGYIFHKQAESPARGPGATVPELHPGCSTDLCKESYINYDSTVDFTRAQNQLGILEGVVEGRYNKSLFGDVDVLAQCPGGKCDPFLQNLKQIRMPNHTNVIRVILAVLFLLAILVGTYAALVATVHDYDTRVSRIGETFGQLAATFARRAQGVLSLASTPKPAPAPAAAAPAASAKPGFFKSLFTRSKPVPQ
jgi:hypothetical protein